MIKIKHGINLLAIIVPVFLIGYLLDFFGSISPVIGDYFIVTTELLPLVLSFSIFAMTWFAYTKSKDRYTLFFGTIFFVSWLFDLYHLLSYSFMPDFVTPNTPEKEAIFWSGARLISALLFLAGAYVYKDTLPRLINVPVLFLSTLALSFIFVIAALFYADYLPAMYQNGSPSNARIFVALLSSMMLTYACFLYPERFMETEDRSVICLIYGFVIVVLSNLISIQYDYSGYLLRAAGYYFMYIGMYRYSIEQSYGKLGMIQDTMRYDAEAKYYSLLNNANDAIVVCDSEDRITSWNRSAGNMFGWKAEEAIGKKISELIIPPFDRNDREKLLHNVVSGENAAGIETVYVRKDGIQVNASVTVSSLQDMKGSIIGFSNIIRDITERKKAEEQIKASLREKEILLREIHHRVKNNMQVISSLLRLQSRYITDENYLRMFKESQSRIISMSNVYEKLYQSKDFSKIDFREYIRDMIAELFQSYGVDTNKIKLNINVEDISLGLDAAIPCGLIINELVTNSIKYAFPDGREGNIRIGFHKTDDGIELIIGDNGAGIPENIDFRTTDSLGLYLVKILAENQLHGKIDLNRNNGTEFKIRFKGVK